MWSRKVLLSLLTVSAIGLCYSEIQDNDGNSKIISFFVESMKKLHREPPIPPSKARANVATEWIEQKLDYFDQTETRTWQMRYMSNDEFFKPGGAIFIMLGGEWEISPGLITSGHFHDMAREHNAMLYYTEHRFYGESKPTSDIRVENLKYLHVKQALEDLKHFIEHIKANNRELSNSKVIIAGGSYSATMVVWFKRLYPELIAGGWASSAPLLAKVDFREYKEVVGRAMLELGSEKCYNRIKNGVAELEDMFVNKRTAEVKAMLKLCNNFDENNDMDVWSLFGSLSNIFSGIVQYQEGNDVPMVCDYLMGFEDDVTAVTSFLLLYVDNYCLDLSYKSTLSMYIDSTYVYGAGRPWYYQTCNEYGWYQTSGSRNQPFGTKFPLDFYTTLCSDVFGQKFTNEFIHTTATKTNDDFGGMEPEVDHVFMTHGGLDPWSPMGHNETQGAAVIPRASHCNDFSSISSSDSAEMRAAKENLAERVRDWLA